MGIEKTKLLTHESVYWVNINTDIKKHIKNCNMCLEFQQTQPKEKIVCHEIPLRPWEVLGTDIFHFNSKNYFMYSRLPQQIPSSKEDGWAINRT